MGYLLMRHRVEDYEKWKLAFDAHASSRTASGVGGGWLLRNADDPQELVIFFKADDLDRARQFAQSEDLKKVMQEAGVVGKPDVYFLEQIEEFPA